MPVEVKIFNYKITLVLLFFILNSYLVLSLKLPIFLLKANLLFFLFAITLFYIKYLKYNFPLKLYFLLIILLCLGTAATNWDTRSIYLFHTKRIFFDESIYSVVDNYASFSHNDYPLLVPAFSSSFAFLIGYWHEIFPKSAFTLMLLPPLIFLSSYLNMKKYLIFLSIVIFFLGQQLFNGAVDGIVSLYFIVCCFCFYQIFISSEQNREKVFLIITFLFSVSLTLIKNEGFAMLFVIFSTVLIMKLFTGDFLKYLKKICLLSLAFIPMVLWKVFCLKNNLSNDYINIGFFDQIIPRLTSIENYKLFFYYFIFSNEKVLIAIFAFLISFYLNLEKKLFYYSILIFFLYFAILFLVHFSTPLEFVHQLQTSSFRLVKTFTLFLGFFAVVNLKIFDKKFSFK